MSRHGGRRTRTSRCGSSPPSPSACARRARAQCALRRQEHDARAAVAHRSRHRRRYRGWAVRPRTARYRQCDADGTAAASSTRFKEAARMRTVAAGRSARSHHHALQFRTCGRPACGVGRPAAASGDHRRRPDLTDTPTAAWRRGRIPHHMLPLSLTFDHRVVTGGDAARFLAAMADDLKRPELPLSRGSHVQGD